jgi:hypothetical protein
MKKKIKNLTEDLLRGPPLGDAAEEMDAPEMHDGADDDQPEDAASGLEPSASIKLEPSAHAEVRRSGGFARGDVQADARLRAIAEQVTTLSVSAGGLESHSE